MSIVNIEEGIRSNASVSGDEITATSVFQVEVSKITDGAIVACRAAGLPRVGRRHPVFPDLNVKNRTSEETESRFIFNINVNYSNRGDVEEDKENPLDEKPSISWDHIEAPRIYTQDIDGNPIENSAEEPFVDPIQGVLGNLAVTITRNEKIFDPKKAREMIFTVNSTRGRVAGLSIPGEAQAMLIRYTANGAVRNEVEFNTVTYRIAFRNPKDKNNPDFNERILDRGLNKLNPAGRVEPKQVEILDTAGNAVSNPVKLDGAGGPLPKGAVPVYLEFETLVRSNFNRLRLPSEGFVAPPKPNKFLQFIGF